jgi:CMP-N,N'-diacetyllegionaminic acid synthase
MRSLGIIPARGGSKGIPLKNIATLHGNPLISYTIEAALASKLNRVIVSTDNKEIAKVARDYSAEVMMRPIELAQDNTPTVPVLQHVTENLEEDFDFIVTLQPTSPFRTANHIDESLDIIKSNPAVDTLVSVIEVPHNFTPSSLMKLRKRYLEQLIDQGREVLRRQDKPKLYARNGPAILIIRKERFRSEQLYTGKTMPYLMDFLSSIDIDCEIDLQIAEHLFELWNKNK